MPSHRHPTKQFLIEAVLDLLTTHKPFDIKVEQVLHVSGISSGSLYHHFKDFNNLIDHALTEQYSQFGDLQIKVLADAVTKSNSGTEFRLNVEAIMDQTHSVKVAETRMFRAWIVSQAAIRDDFRELLSTEQNRITDGLEDVVREAQAKGWARADFDPRVIATFILAYTIGRVVDDVANPSVNNDEWIRFMKHMIRSTLLLETES
jgi:AcrR family transcriptional regulator